MFIHAPKSQTLFGAFYGLSINKVNYTDHFKYTVILSP